MTAAEHRGFVGTGSVSDRWLGIARAAWTTLGAIAVALAAVVGAAAGLGSEAGAQSSVPPVLSCPGSMVLDSGSGQCRTPQTETVLRPSSCPSGWTRVAGQFGGHECQRRVSRQVDTGRTRQVYSHSTYDEVWVPTGTRREQTGTNRIWVPPREVVEPLVPPVRVQVGTKRRCDYDFLSGQHYNCRNVPVYEWQRSHTVTIPGYWREEPIYTEVETGYWDRVENRHYTTESIYETVVEWQTRRVSQGSCGTGWDPVGNQCQRTRLGDPSAPPQQSCPSGTVPRYADAISGMGPGVLSCQSSSPSSDLDTGTDQDTSGGPSVTPDGTARPLHHLAGESDERLAELGIDRCSDGLLSYVPCDELPGRAWDSEPDVCKDIEGTVYRPDHGGSCVTESDLLKKCILPGDCEETTIRTYCPAIGELAHTQIQEHVHPDRGAETYRVCVFDCSDSSALPPYVQSRINGSYDYACLPVPEPEPTDPPPPPSSTTTTTEASADETKIGGQVEPVDGEEPDTPHDDRDRDPGPDPASDPEGPVSNPDPDPSAPPAQPPVRPFGDTCTATPTEQRLAGIVDELVWVSHVRAAPGGTSLQQHMPGGGEFLLVAPGRGWMQVSGSLDVVDGDCGWIATWVRSNWSEMRPWIAAERRLMEGNAGTRHLVDRWDALSADQQLLLSQWHQPGADPAEPACPVAVAAGPGASAACGWLFGHPGAYAWDVQVCFEPQQTANGTSTRSAQPHGDDACWVTVASGVDWIRSLSDYASGRVTLTASGAGL